MTLVKDLLRRRIPQVVAIYLGGCWALVEFVDFIALRYAFSPHITDLALLLPILLLPSVVLVTYFHGVPGKDEWVWAEKVGVPINLIVAISVILVYERGKDLGAATTTVTVTDEEGMEIERVIPKSEFRRRIAVFFFDAEPADTAASWLQYGLPNALTVDLSQDHFFDAQNPPLFADRLREAGFTELNRVPLALQREIAEERHRDQFVSGTVAVEGTEIRTTVFLYETERGRLLEEHTFVGEDVMELADRITTQLKVDLEVPDLGDEGVKDLPVSEVLTSSLEAYRTFTEGVREIQVDMDFEGGAETLRRAVAQDPTFALAQYALAQLLYLSNRTQEAAGPLQAAMDQIYRIPERVRFQVKSDYYLIVRQDMEKALASIEMWGDLFPDDVAAYQARVQIQAVRSDRPGMLVSLEKIRELDPARREILLQIGDLHESMGELDTARAVFQEYADEFPQNHEVLQRLARVSRAQGNLEEALGFLDRALLLAPSDVGLMVGMGTARRALGEFEEALRQYELARSAATTPEELAQVHAGLESYYRTRGQMGRALEHAEQRIAQVALFQPGLFSVQIRLGELPRAYAEAGREADAWAVIEDVRSQLPPPFDALLPLGELGIQLARRDADGIEALLPGIEGVIATFQYQVLRPRLVFAQGRMHELRGEYREAIALYEEEGRLSPGDTGVPAQLARCYRELGEHDRAVELFQEALRSFPWAPVTNLDLALTFEAAGRTLDARRHLERALEVWADADEGYEPARDAREALARIGG